MVSCFYLPGEAVTAHLVRDLAATALAARERQSALGNRIQLAPARRPRAA